MYTTSHGCPYSCAYCSNAAVYGRNLDELPAGQVVEEVAYLVRKYHINLVGIIDDIFFASRPRSLELAEGFIRAGLKFEWYIQDRADSWERLTDEQARMFRRSGLARIHFGAESGSDEVLKAIGKKSDAESILAAVERCKAAGLRASFGFIFGLPAEKEEDLRKSIDLIRRINESYDRADCYTSIFTPYPGSPAWQESIDKGLAPPGTLEEWVDFYPRLQVLPWLSGRKHDRLQAIRQYLRFGYHQVRVGEQSDSWQHRLLFGALKPMARYRLKNHQYRFPLEIYGYRGLLRLKRDLLHSELF
jgi:radical SAM superfamily enzyme YgiQ (UPF0313 family)